MHFTDSHRVKIDHQQGLVRLSIKSNDQSVDEFMIPVSEFDELYESVSERLNYSSENLKLKYLDRHILFQIRESIAKRRIFKFTETRMLRMMSEFASEKLMYLNWLETEGKGYESTSAGIFSLGGRDCVAAPLALNLSKKVDHLIEVCHSINSGLSSLHHMTKLMYERMGEMEINQNIIQGGNTEIKREEFADIGFEIDEEESHFIPDDLNKDFDGTLISLSESASEDVSDAAKALKELRRKKK